MIRIRTFISPYLLYPGGASGVGRRRLTPVPGTVTLHSPDGRAGVNFSGRMVEVYGEHLACPFPAGREPVDGWDCDTEIYGRTTSAREAAAPDGHCAQPVVELELKRSGALPASGPRPLGGHPAQPGPHAGGPAARAAAGAGGR